MSNSFVFSEILPLNSIINPDTLSKDYLDLRSPFSFFDFLKYTETELSPIQFNDLYVEYIRKWGIAKKNTQTQINQTIQERYIELIKQITLKHSSLDEKRFLTNIDYTDKSELDILIPFYSQKITEICNFYSQKREKLKFKIQKNKNKGTSNSVEKTVFETITDVVFADTLEVSEYQKLINENQLLKNLNIEIEELYDIYTNYLDNNPSKNYDYYDVNTDLRKKLYSANINDIDANIFLNLDQAIRSQLFGNVVVFLYEFKKNFSINYDIDAINLNCKPDDRLFNLVNENKPKASRLVELRSRLIKKYIGCNFHYIITGNTTSDVTTDILFKADNPSGNLLNRHFPTTASIEEESDLQSCRRIGLFFTPEKNSILYFSVPERKYKVDTTKLEPNKLYIFPDPELYGNTVGLSNVYNNQYPLIHICDYIKSVKNQSYGFSHGDINSSPYTQDFYAYFSRNQISDLDSFGKDGLKNNFSILANKGIVSNWSSDIYGNQFALFKAKTKENIVNNSIIVDELNSIVYEDYSGGPITFSNEGLLPDEVFASNPEWVAPNVWSSNYYYNILIEGGVGGIYNGLMERGIYFDYRIDGLVLDRINKLGLNVFDIRLNDIEDLLYKPLKKLDGIPLNSSQFTPSFNNDYILSSIKYKEFDAGDILNPEGEIYDFEEQTNFIVNQKTQESETILYSSSNQIKNNTYEFKNSYGTIYVKDIVTGYVSELSSALKNQFNDKYNSIKNEFYNKVLDFNIYNDFVWIRTTNNLIFDKLLYQDNGYVYSGTGENIITYKINDRYLTNVSNPFIFEDRDYCMVVLLSASNVNSNNYSIVPFIYKIDYSTGTKTLINSLSSLENTIKTIYKNKGNTKIRRINKPVLTYNSRNNKYCILATIEDQNELFYIYKVFFDYNGLNILNEECKLYDASQKISRNTRNGYDNPNIITTDFSSSNVNIRNDIKVDPKTGDLVF